MIATDISSLFTLERGELILDSGLTYDGTTPVLVRVTRREDRYLFSDGGGAVAAAGPSRAWLEFGKQIVEREHLLNLGRQGAVFVPAVGARGQEWLSTLPGRVAEASSALYSALLELDS